jgi:serine/threonine-protein kinase
MGGVPRYRQFVTTRFDEKSPDFSPDGRWLAYQSNASGRYEIYIRPFETSSGERETRVWPASTAGGIYPAWSRDGRELY